MELPEERLLRDWYQDRLSAMESDSLLTGCAADRQELLGCHRGPRA